MSDTHGIDIQSVPAFTPHRNMLGSAGLMFIRLAVICLFAAVIFICVPLINHLTGSYTIELTFSRLAYDAVATLILIITGFTSALMGRALLYAGQKSNYSSLSEKALEILRQAIIDGKAKLLTNILG